MVTKETNEIIDSSVSLLLLFLHAGLLISLFRGFRDEKRQTSILIKMTIAIYFTGKSVWCILEIINDIATYLKLETTIDEHTLELIFYITWIIQDTIRIAIDLSLAFFLKIILEHTFQETFLEINKLFSNISFVLYSLAQFFHNIITIIRFDLSYWYPSLSQ
eukprot:264938_1